MPSSGSIAICLATDWIARLNAREASEDAWPSWSRASSYAGAIDVPASVSWNWLKSVSFQASASSSPGYACAPSTSATTLHFSARCRRFSARRFQRFTPLCDV
jgi:hypothetical protein